MIMPAPPEVGPDEYERRVLASLRGLDMAMGTSVADVWLEGKHPETQIVVVVQVDAPPAGRYVYRHDLWYAGTDSNPEMQIAPIVTGIMESSPWGMGRGRHPGWTYEPRPPLLEATPRRPDLDASVDVSHPVRLPQLGGRRASRPWPRPPESDPDLHERCLLSVFQGEWPGFRAQIEDAWLEHQYPDTMIVLALTRMARDAPIDARAPGLPAERVVHRTAVWRKSSLPTGVETQGRHVGDVVDGLIEWCYLAKRGRLPTASREMHETRPPNLGAAPRRPRL